ncbi:MAG TPA: 1-acyl-sn-glycerol-3-phosphate acyltransferase [Chitinophagaceae bacterium]
MIYRLLKAVIRPAMLIFCRKVIINKREMLRSKGPLLLACNHPNSFLDSVILDVLFEQPIWSLARGDVFKNKITTRLLTSLKILPVYRSSEGVENLSSNYKTFEKCITIFKNNGLVQIFSEGKCINEWRLRPLKKGTARLAIRAWEENIPLKVLPVGINYSSFRRFGKNIFINFGDIITKASINFAETDGLRHQSFNKKLEDQLKQLVYEIPKSDLEQQVTTLTTKSSLLKKMLLAIPAMIGWLLHAPLYLPVRKYVWGKTNHNDHYDSVMTGVLLFIYPLYLLLIILLLFLITHSLWILLLLLLLPFTALSYIQLKPQLDK